MARIESLNMLADPTGKMYLQELYAGVIENVDRGAISGRLKNKRLSGDPNSGTLVARRFQDSTSDPYGTARAAGKGQSIKGKEVVIALDQDKEFTKDIEKKDVYLSGVDNFLQILIRDHQKGLIRELDKAFFAEAESAGTIYTPPSGLTAIQDIISNAIVTLTSLSTNYIDGIDREDIRIQVTDEIFEDIHNFIDTRSNANIDTAANDFGKYHGVVIEATNHLPNGVNFIVQAVESIAQPVMVTKINSHAVDFSEAIGTEVFFHYGTKAVTPELILVNKSA